MQLFDRLVKVKHRKVRDCSANQFPIKMKIDSAANFLYKLSRNESQTAFKSRDLNSQLVPCAF